MKIWLFGLLSLGALIFFNKDAFLSYSDGKSELKVQLNKKY